MGPLGSMSMVELTNLAQFILVLRAASKAKVAITVSAVPVAELTQATETTIAVADFYSRLLHCRHSGCFTECGMRHMVTLALD